MSMSPADVLRTIFPLVGGSIIYICDILPIWIKIKKMRHSDIPILIGSEKGVQFWGISFDVETFGNGSRREKTTFWCWWEIYPRIRSLLKIFMRYLSSNFGSRRLDYLIRPAIIHSSSSISQSVIPAKWSASKNSWSSSWNPPVIFCTFLNNCLITINFNFSTFSRV